VEAIEYKESRDSGWRDRIVPEQFDLDLESEKKRKEMIDRVNRIKYILFGLDSPLPKMFTDYNRYFKPRWDKTKTEKKRERMMEEYKDTLSGLSDIWFLGTAMEREINEKTKQLKQLEMSGSGELTKIRDPDFKIFEHRKSWCYEGSFGTDPVNLICRCGAVVKGQILTFFAHCPHCGLIFRYFKGNWSLMGKSHEEDKFKLSKEYLPKKEQLCSRHLWE